MAQLLTVDAGRPGAYPTLEDALEIAEDDCVITVAPGTYAETVEVTGRRLTITAAEAGKVTIDATATDRPVMRTRGGALTLRGLELKASDAAAVEITGGELTIENCPANARDGARLNPHDPSPAPAPP